VEEQSITAKEIASNVNQSAQAASDVVQNITGISTATEDGAKNAQNLSTLAAQLDTLSLRLSQIVSRFKI
jgi:methyl-accepting chemotaxis protein